MSASNPSSRIERDFDLASMNLEELETLQRQVDSELEARSFEDNLRREVESHMRKQEWARRTEQGSNSRSGRRRL
ncbi:hypothetical protein [Arhodomonas sp. AD133]|uniref:hypothetical protein n=1 Tax=Arhodomonas sp. AD133 TaxID=3415009 RepID=UPI003EBF0443